MPPPVFRWLLSLLRRLRLGGNPPQARFWRQRSLFRLLSVVAQIIKRIIVTIADTSQAFDDSLGATGIHTAQVDGRGSREGQDVYLSPTIAYCQVPAENSHTRVGYDVRHWHAAASVHLNQVRSSPKISNTSVEVIPITWDDFIPRLYHFGKDSESGSDAESCEFDPSRMVQPEMNSRVVSSRLSSSPNHRIRVHPRIYLHSDRSASPSSQESYRLRSLSVQHLPATLSVQHPPASLSVQHLPALPPSPNLGPGGYLPSTNTSVVNFHIPEPATESPNQSPRSSRVFGDVALPSVPLLSVAHPRIFPGTPESLGRYNRAVIPNEPTRFTIPPLTICLLPVAPPPGWTACLHPEGAQYFFHEEKLVFTDANLFDTSSLEFITTTIRTIHDFLRAHGVQLEPDVNLVLDEYTYFDKSKGCQYYFVNHKDRCVFWMDNAESDLFSITHELNGITSASQIHLITSPTSTAGWKLEELDHMLSLIDGFGKNIGNNDNNRLDGSTSLAIRARVYNFHGEPAARLNIHQSVYATVRKRTWLIRLLGPLLFYAPDFHLVGLHMTCTDGLIRHREWSEFIVRLNREWHEFTLYAEVVLNANVAFLSIQSVDQGSNSRSPTQISSYLSTLTSIGAIIIGLLLVKQNRDRDRLPAEDAARFILNRTHSTLGTETLAVLYSLPYAMLIWSMVSFLAAFSFMCFENSSLVTRTLVAVLLATVAALILWCVFAEWESADWDWLTTCPRNWRRAWHWPWPSITTRKGSYDFGP
ncbi:hypothetical protein C8R44DRAFT_874477 [Mycena epipterygia]|nr:hypothetical protein C8R44DRAFT_874477 [Mycena epipterygia]